MKRNYEARGRRRVEVKRGDLVAWHVQEQGLGKSKKLNAKWKGPYRVVQVKWPKAELKDRNGKRKEIHLNHLKPVTSTRPLEEFRGRGRPRILRGRSNGR